MDVVDIKFSDLNYQVYNGIINKSETFKPNIQLNSPCKLIFSKKARFKRR